MGSNQKPGGRAWTLVTSQRLLVVVVALALAAYAASTWYTRHMWSRVNDATDTFAAESVYGLATISATRETLWKVDSLLHRQVQHSSDLDLKTRVDELRSELGTDGDRLLGERPERDDLGTAAADLRAVQGTVDRVEAAVTAGDRVGARRLIETLDRSAHGVEALLDAAQEVARREAAEFEVQLARLRRRAGQIQRVFDVANGLLTLIVGLFAVRALRAGARVEGMARREAAKFQGVVSSAPDAIVSVDEHQQIVLFNESAERVFGWSSGEAKGKHFDILACERLRPTVRAQFDRLVGEDGEPRRTLDMRGEWIGVRKSGEEFAAEVAVSMLEAAGPTLVTAIFRDVTERKRADEALRASESRFHALVDASAEVLWTVGAEGQALEDCPSWRAFTGQSPEQYKGFGWLDVVHPDDRGRVAEQWRGAARERTPFSVEYRVHHTSGRWRWVAERAVPLFGPDGTIIEWIGMNSDIHERKRVESEQRFLAELEPLLDSTLDYRERLTILARVLASRVGDWCSAWIAGNGDRPPVCKVLHAGADPAKEGVCELEQLPAVWVDRDRLEQVFANLIANSVNFTPAGGRITIGAAPTEGGAVRFRVTDTGAGFDAESREHLFDRFWQARKGVHHGVGLGLSIVKSIVEAHGGHVSVEGGPGLGSTFYFTIPAAAA